MRSKLSIFGGVTGINCLVILALLLSACYSAPRTSGNDTRPVPTKSPLSATAHSPISRAASTVAISATPAPTAARSTERAEAQAPSGTTGQVVEKPAEPPAKAGNGVAAAPEHSRGAPVQPMMASSTTGGGTGVAEPPKAKAVSAPRAKHAKKSELHEARRPKLRIPRAGTDYDIQLRIEGYTTYLYAEGRGRRHVVASERTRVMPGMFAKYVVLSPDHRTVTYATAPKALTDRMRMWTVGVNGRHRRLLADIPAELWTAAPVWSPDSKRIAYVRATSPWRTKPGLELWVIKADGSGNHKLFSGRSFNTSIFYNAEKHPLRWTEYGNIQFRDYNTRTIHTVDGRTGELSSQKANIHAPEVSIPVVETKSPIVINSQNDPRWRYDRINPCADTMGNSGCAINALTMSFSAYGVDTDAKQMNRNLDKFACPIYWSWASKYFSNSKLQLWGVWQFDWHSLDLALAKRRPALVWLADAYTTGEALLSHWVLVVGGEGQTPSGYRIYDPWDGTTYKTLAYYTSKGYGLKRVYVYAPRPPKHAKPQRPRPTKHR